MRKILAFSILTLCLGVFYQNCSPQFKDESEVGGEYRASSTKDPNQTPQDTSPVVAGSGPLFAGTGAMSVPTAEGIIGRIKNGLEGNAVPTAGNFAIAVAQLKSNLPKVADPSKATGFDQAQLLAYAACSDIAGGTLMTSKYSINPTATIASNKNSLITAGLRILDQLTAGIASQSSATPQIRTALGNLVDKLSGTASNTSKIAFMSVCIASLTVGTTMLGL